MPILFICFFFVYYYIAKLTLVFKKLRPFSFSNEENDNLFYDVLLILIMKSMSKKFQKTTQLTKMCSKTVRKFNG